MSLALTTLFILQPEASTSGKLDRESLSKEEIVQLLVDDYIPLPENVFKERPLVTSPYASGSLTLAAQNAALARLNAIRTLAGIPEVVLDAEFSEDAQYGAVLLCVSNYAHNPKQPSDMNDEFFKKGRNATASSNLYGKKTLLAAVDGFMDDSDSFNLPHLGHRRWQLSPYMSKVGFGYAENTKGKGYVVEKIADLSAEKFDYNYISWPSSGYFPQEFMENPYIAWSVVLNNKVYKMPDTSVSVTMKRHEDGKTWTLSGTYKETSTAYLNIDRELGFPGPCIVFRPDGIEKYTGTYTVRIDGLKYKDGTPAELTYDVEFFAMSDYGENPFSDLARTNWAYKAAESAYKAGLIQGVSQDPKAVNVACAPRESLTWQEYEYILKKLFYGDDWSGTGTKGKVTRYDFAEQLSLAICEKLGYEEDPEFVFQEDIPEEYSDAVRLCCQLGLMAGKGSAGFCGDDVISHAEAYVVLDRLNDLEKGALYESITE